MKRNVQIFLGIIVWAVGGGLVFVAASPRDAARRASHAEITRYLVGSRENFERIDASGILERNDPVFIATSTGEWRQVGYVRQATTDSDVVTLTWHDADHRPDDCELEAHYNTGRLDEVVATLFPPSKQARIKQRISAAMQLHGEELSAAFLPLVQRSLQDSLPVIEDEFELALARHREELNGLAERWNNEVIAKRLIPLARREIMPIVVDRGQPTAEEIGRELWDRASLWRFGWRALYDKAPLPNRNLVQAEWNRFVEREAVPVFESHMDEIVGVVQSIVTDVAANESVRSELGEVADELVADPEARDLVRSILRETLVDNQRLREVWKEVWTSSEARQALDLAGDRLEPVVRSIGDEIFGSREGGIEPDFARVLRSQILRKDRRWVVARPRSNPNVETIRLSTQTMTYPMVYMADPEDEPQ